MTRRQTFINKIRELGFGYKRHQKRTYLYHKPGTTDYIAVPMTELLDDGYVRSVLRQNGLKEDEIEKFLSSAKT